MHLTDAQLSAVDTATNRAACVQALLRIPLTPGAIKRLQKAQLFGTTEQTLTIEGLILAWAALGNMPGSSAGRDGVRGWARNEEAAWRRELSTRRAQERQAKTTTDGQKTAPDGPKTA